MKKIRILVFVIFLIVLSVACSTSGGKDTIDTESSDETKSQDVHEVAPAEKENLIGDLNLQSYGVYLFQNGNAHLLFSSRGKPIITKDFTYSESNRPTFLFWLPDIQWEYVTFTELLTRNSYSFDTRTSDNGAVEIEIQQALPEGDFCFAQGDPLASPVDVMHWCFTIKPVVALGGPVFCPNPTQIGLNKVLEDVISLEPLGYDPERPPRKCYQVQLQGQKEYLFRVNVLDPNQGVGTIDIVFFNQVGEEFANIRVSELWHKSYILSPQDGGTYFIGFEPYQFALDRVLWYKFQFTDNLADVVFATEEINFGGFCKRGETDLWEVKIKRMLMLPDRIRLFFEAHSRQTYPHSSCIFYSYEYPRPSAEQFYHPIDHDYTIVTPRYHNKTSYEGYLDFELGPTPTFGEYLYFNYGCDGGGSRELGLLSAYNIIPSLPISKDQGDLVTTDPEPPVTPSPSTTLPIRLIAYNYNVSEPENGWVDAEFSIAIENISEHEFLLRESELEHDGPFLDIDWLAVKTEEGIPYEIRAGQAITRLVLVDPIPVGFRFPYHENKGSAVVYKFRFAEAATPRTIQVQGFPELNFELPLPGSPAPQFPYDESPVEFSSLNLLTGKTLENEKLRITLSGRCMKGNLEAHIENLDRFNDTSLKQVFDVPILSIHADTGIAREVVWWGGDSTGGRPEVPYASRDHPESADFIYTLGPGQSADVWLRDTYGFLFSENHIFRMFNTWFDTSECEYEE